MGRWYIVFVLLVGCVVQKPPKPPIPPKPPPKPPGPVYRDPVLLYYDSAGKAYSLLFTADRAHWDAAFEKARSLNDSLHKYVKIWADSFYRDTIGKQPVIP